MPDSSLYTESLTSNRTTALFAALTLLFLGLFLWLRSMAEIGCLAALSFGFCLFFLFYTLNYRRLRIRFSVESLILRFGLFFWEIPVENIQSCSLDRISLWRIGGAGIHFSSYAGRYRAMFNFLEYPGGSSPSNNHAVRCETSPSPPAIPSNSFR